MITKAKPGSAYDNLNSYDPTKVYNPTEDPYTDFNSIFYEPQPANVVFAGPASGSPALPAMRALVAADVPFATGGGTGNYAVDTTVVHNTGNESIDGVKTFTSTIVGNISGNAGTVTNGVVTTGSYADPSWITSLANSKITGLGSAALQSSNFFSKSYGLTTDTDGATITFDMTSSSRHMVTIAGNRTLAVSNDQVGQTFVIILSQDATGSRTVTWFSGIKWAGGTAPTLTTTANKSDIFTFIKIATGSYFGFVSGQNA